MSTANDDRQPLLDPVRRLYEDSLKEHGVQSRAVGWRDEASQRLRFDRLANVVDASAGPFTVNDLGCGYGAMFDYLAERFGDSLTGYTGVDVSEQMLAAARGRLSDPRASFVHGDSLTTDADYAFVSGTFNVKMEATDAAWAEYVTATLAAMMARSTRGMAFNLLTSYVDWKQDHLFYADPCHFFDFARRNLARAVTLYHDYPLYEWTLVVRR